MATDLTDTWLRKESGGKSRDIADARQAGLTVRLGPTGTSWWFRTKAGGVVRRTMFGTFPQLSIVDARKLAAAASEVIRRGVAEPDAIFFLAKRLEFGIDRLDIVPQAPMRSKDKWTFAQARDAYLGEVSRTRRPATHRSYSEFLRHPVLKPLEGRPVSGITRQELATILAAVHSSGSETQAKNTAAALRPMWTYLALDHVVMNSGVEPEIMAKLKPPERSRIANGKRTERDPGIAAVGRLLAIARSGLLRPVVASAIELTVLTGQRRLTVVAARRACFTQSGVHYVWTMPAEDMKAGDVRRGPSGDPLPDHELSLPAGARSAVERMLKFETDSEWLFPQVRPRRLGDAVGHLHEASLTHAVGELPDVGFSPHDLRRAFTSALRSAGYPRDSSAIILDHAEGRSGVTMRHYDRFRELDEKLEKLTVWSTAVEAAAADEATRLDLCLIRDHLRTVRLKRAPKTRTTRGRRGQTPEAG